MLFTPADHVVHLRGPVDETGAAPGRPSHYDRSHVAFYEKHAPGWAPWLRFWLRLRGPAHPIESRAEPQCESPSTPRKLHDYGIGTYVRNLRQRTGPAGR